MFSNLLSSVYLFIHLLLSDVLHNANKGQNGLKMIQNTPEIFYTTAFSRGIT